MPKTIRTDRKLRIRVIATGVIIGGMPADVVTTLRESGIFTTGKTNREFMRAAAGRALSYNGRHVRTHSAAAFLQDLAAAGDLEILRTH